MQRTTLLPVLMIAAALSGCAGDTYTRGSATTRSGSSQIAVIFSDYDRAEIRRYFGKQLPPGLAKRDELPPGLKKQLVTRGTLPPGLSGQPLPGDLERRLSRLPEGYVRLRVGTDVVLLDRKTRGILDLVKDIGR